MTASILPCPMVSFTGYAIACSRLPRPTCPSTRSTTYHGRHATIGTRRYASGCRRLSDLVGCLRINLSGKKQRKNNQVVYKVISSAVPEIPRELAHSITTICPGSCDGDLYVTKGHQHPDPRCEIYFGLEGTGGIIMFDGKQTFWIRITPGKIGYIPPGWADRSINTGEDEYIFLAVYAGSAGHDYQ